MKKILLFVFLSFFAFNSCEKESNPVSPDADIIIPKDGTKVLTEEIKNQLVNTNLSQDSLYFNGDVNDLKVNDIIISDAGDGVLRKIQSIEKVGSQSLVITDTTTMEDAFEEIAFEDSIEITEDEIENIVYHIPGIELLKTNNTNALTFGVTDVVLYDNNGAQLKGSGSFTLELKPKFKCKIKGGGLKEFKATVTPTGTIDINVSATQKLTFLDVKKKVATIKTKKITIWVGWVPVVIKTEIPIYLGAKGEISATIDVGIKNETSLTFGGEYKNGSFNFIAEPRNKFTFTPPTITDAASLKFYIQPNINFKVYGAAGPQLIFDIFLLGEAELIAGGSGNSEVSAKIYGGLDAKVGMILKIFKKNLSVTSPPLFEIKLLLKEWKSVYGGGGGLPPTVTTNQIWEYSSTEAYDAGGNVTDEGSASVTARGVCWSTSQNPTISDNKTNDGSGLGPFQSIIQGLSPSTTYYVRAYATNSAGTGYGNQVYFTTLQAGGFACGSQIEYAGKTYNTVQIGNQCWLKENLDVGTRINGSQNQTNNSTIEKYCYHNDPNNCNTYGGLYQWDETMQYVTTEGAQGICPVGWHIPTYAEFQTLKAAVNNDGNSLKAIGQGTGSGAGTNTSGFSALLAGWGGNFAYLGIQGVIWSSTELSATNATDLIVFYNSNGIALGNDVKQAGFSVRCIKD